MSNYTKATDFAQKDGLPTNDPNKVIKGAEFEDEFDLIATAVNSKADTASPTFTGTATLPTAVVTTLSLGGTTITSTGTELNLLDGVTASTTELNLLDGVTATTAELNYVDGVTSNIQTQLDAKGTVSSLSDLSVTATADELNKLDGVTVTTAELNYVDGVTSNIQTQLDAKGTVSSLSDLSVTATASELNILDGVTSTASELNILDGVTSTASELNLVDGSSAGTVVNDKAVVYSSAGQVKATTLSIGNWVIKVDTNELVFEYDSTEVFKVGTNGAVTSADNVIAFGTI